MLLLVINSVIHLQHEYGLLSKCHSPNRVTPCHKAWGNIPEEDTERLSTRFGERWLETVPLDMAVSLHLLTQSSFGYLHKTCTTQSTLYEQKGDHKTPLLAEKMDAKGGSLFSLGVN